MQNFTKALVFFIIVAIIFGFIIAWVAFWLPQNTHLFVTYPPANTTYTSENCTAAFYLSVQTVPTVINGITTATAIMVGFTGSIIGIVIHEFPKETRQDRKFRIFIMVLLPLLFVFVLILDFWGYVWLLEGGALFASAITSILTGFLLAMLILIGLFIFVGYRLDDDERKIQGNVSPAPQTLKKDEEQLSVVTKDDKQVNITITVN